MAIKKDMRVWAIKVRGRSFLLNIDGMPVTFRTRAEAAGRFTAPWIKPVRVRVRIEEIE